MSSNFQIDALFPRLQGLVDPKAEKELFLAFHRIYDYFNNKIDLSNADIQKATSKQTQQLATETSQLISNFASKLVGQGNQGNNPLQTLGSGTVTSVSSSGNILFAGSGPIVDAGSLSFTLLTQNKNKVLAGPITGADASPTFRLLASNDMPRTSSAANPSITELPNSGDWCLHKNTTSGFIYLAYNNGGAIVKVQL